MSETEIEVGGRTIYVEIQEPTLRQSTRIYGKYLKPKMKLDGKQANVQEMEIDLFGMALEMMTATVKVVRIDDQEVQIKTVEDWDTVDEIDRRVPKALMGVMVEKFRTEAGAFGL